MTRIIALLSARNESDIIEYTIQHILANGLEIIVLDDSSTDDTPKLIGKYLGKGRVLEYFIRESSSMALIDKFGKLHQEVQKYSPDWVIICDADEFMQTDVKGETVRDGIIRVDNLGYKSINFAEMEFVVTKHDESTEPVPILRMRHFIKVTKSNHFRAYKIKDCNIPYRHHTTQFPNPYPKFFLFKHYPFRSLQQAKEKLADRMSRYVPKEDTGTHYQVISKNLNSYVLTDINYKSIDDYTFEDIRRMIDNG